MEDIVQVAQIEKEMLMRKLGPLIDEFILTKMKLVQMRENGLSTDGIGLALDSILTNIDIIFKHYSQNILSI